MADNPDIIVSAYSQRYAAAVKELLVTEGGFADDPVDRGGTTKYGISLRFLASEGAFDSDGDGRADFDLDFDGDIDGKDIRLLSRGDAVYLYHRCFWLMLDADSFPRPVGEMLFDQGVNGGISAARKMLQQALNACLVKGKRDVPPLKVDGVIGAKTREAFDIVLCYPALGMVDIITAYREAVRARYRAIVARYPSQKRFLRGWLARAERLGR